MNLYLYDLATNNKERNQLRWQGGLTAGAGGDPLLPAHRSAATYLARVLSRFPNSIVIGPGNARLWHMDPHFDLASPT